MYNRYVPSPDVILELVEEVGPFIHAQYTHFVADELIREQIEDGTGSENIFFLAVKPVENPDATGEVIAKIEAIFRPNSSTMEDELNSVYPDPVESARKKLSAMRGQITPSLSGQSADAE